MYKKMRKMGTSFYIGIKEKKVKQGGQTKKEKQENRK